MSIFKNKIAWVAIWLVAIVYCIIESDGLGDFYIFLSAAYDLSPNHLVYEKKYVDGYHYYYSVLFAVVLKPLCYLPFRPVKFCWQLLNFGLYAHLFSMLAGAEAVKRLSEKQRAVFLGSTFLFSLRFLLGNIAHSQITILILWCCVYGMYCIMHNKPIKGGLVLALGINIKLLPLVFLPYLLYRGYFKAFAFAVLFYAAGFVIPSFFIGQHYNMLLLKSWFSLVNPVNQNHVLDTAERSFHSLSTLLSTLLIAHVPDLHAMHIKRNIADVSIETLRKTLLVVRLFLVGFTLYFLRSKPFQKATSNMGMFAEISYLLLLIPLIFPHQQHYAFLFTVPAFAVVAYDLVVNFESLSKARRFFRIFFLALVYLSGNLTLLLGVFNGYYEHFKIITYGALLLIPLLATVSLKNEKSPGEPAARPANT